MLNFKLLFLCGIFSLCVTNASAQKQIDYESRHDVAVGIGSITNTRFITVLGEITQVMTSATITSIVSGGAASAYYTYEDKSWSIPVTAEYFYRVNRFLGVGAIGAFNCMKQDIYLNTTYKDGTQTTEKDGRLRQYNLTLLPAVKFDWLRREHIGLYSKVGLGVSLMIERQKEDDGDKLYSCTDVMFNFQLSAIGFEAGNLHVRGFAELGIGEQGVFVAGLRYKF